MIEPPGEEWTFFGKHQHRFEPPDIYYCRVIGDVSGRDMETQINVLAMLAAKQGQSIFWLADVRDVGTLTPEARRVTANASSTEVRAALAGSAVFGASFTARVMMTLLVRAVRILNPSKIRPLAFVETEQEARAFLNLHRGARQHESSLRKGNF